MLAQNQITHRIGTYIFVLDLYCTFQTILKIYENSTTIIEGKYHEMSRTDRQLKLSVEVAMLNVINSWNLRTS